MRARTSIPSPARSRPSWPSVWRPDMARSKTSADPAELEKLEWPYDWPPPWRNERLIGHEQAEKTMLLAQQVGRLHHAWLLTGPRGIGKATLAWKFARFLLAGQPGGLFASNPDTLDVMREAPGRALVDARSHPDLYHLRRTLNTDTGRMRSEISVDDVRGLGEFMHMTPAMGEWRVAIIDSADEMNRSSANAVLKILEEPPPKAVLLIVAQAPRRMRHDQQHRLGRRLLEDLQHGVGAAAIHLVGGVDNRHAPLAHRRRHVHELAQPAHIVDRDLRAHAAGVRVERAAEMIEVGMRARIDQGPARRFAHDVERVGVARKEPARLAGEQEARELPRERRLADAARSRQQPGVMQPADLLGQQHRLFRQLV